MVVAQTVNQEKVSCTSITLVHARINVGTDQEGLISHWYKTIVISILMFNPSAFEDVRLTRMALMQGKLV